GQRNEVIVGGALVIERDRIVAVGQSAALRGLYPDAQVLDARGKLALPGNICAHTHFYGAFARGMYLGGPAPTNFTETLESLWWRLDKALTLEDVKYSALVCLADAIRHGTTTVMDHHASPHAVDGSLDAIAEAVQEAGLRACLCYEVSDRDGADIRDAGIRENVRFIKAQRARPNPLLAGTFGLHASFTLSDETLERCVAEATPLNVGFHIHVAEDKADVQDNLQKYGLRVVERLEKRGILGPQTIAAHCVHIDAYEVDILRDTGSLVAHNPRSNMNNAVGVAPVPKMLRSDVLVGLGNDGFSNNMFTEMLAAYLVQKLHSGDPRAMPADHVLQIAVANNASIAQAFFPTHLGELTEGAAADIVLLDYVPTTPLTAQNLPWHVIFGLDGSHVDTTIVAGRVLMQNRQLLTLDEERICARSRDLAARLWLRA
ncbi:MAG: putative aminohydrolase SsnA, partial [Chloroflexi bacterium]|nr:putative aminohydrolase SsnA [Chloroflexota bacterium]